MAQDGTDGLPRMLPTESVNAPERRFIIRSLAISSAPASTLSVTAGRPNDDETESFLARSTLQDRQSRCWWCPGALFPCGSLQWWLALGLVAVCVAADGFLFQRTILSTWTLLRHLVDSAAHATVGALTWGLFLCLSGEARVPNPLLGPTRRQRDPTTALSAEWELWRPFLTSCAIAGITAAALDVDHFVAARAWSLKGATHLQSRPFGHAVTFIVAVASLVWLLSKPQARIYRTCFMISAMLSHQLRDANRRGLWFWPVGSTPAIVYPLYVLMELALPVVLARWQLAGRDSRLSIQPRSCEQDLEAGRIEELPDSES